MEGLYGGPERRSSERIEVKFIVTYQVHRPMQVRMWIGNKEINALMLDLSERGMAILTKHEMPPSSILAIKFTLINLQAKNEQQIRSMEIMGKVLYSYLADNEHRLGISFMRLAEEDKSAITRFIKAAMNQ
jgi:c-di-GMP-binding flagellar brake protein YcgR